MKQWLGFVCLTLLLIVAGNGYFMYAGLTRPMAIPNKEMLYEYPKGRSVKMLSDDLAQQEIIPSGFAFLWYARLSQMATHLHAGEYLLTSSMTPIDLLAKMRQGDIYMHTLRLPEGGVLKNIVTLMLADPSIKHTIAYEGDWFHAISNEYISGEGMLLPETYFYPKGETDLALLKRAYRDMMLFAKKAFDERDAAVPYSDIYQTLIVASIIEKEASLPEERTKIARVIINRLDKKMPLQMDPTVIYGMGDAFDGRLRKKDLTTPSAYNTYINEGLPPTPICMPSKNAIVSALHPAEGDYLYFVSRGDGSHYFSSTLKEHNQAVIKYVINAPKKEVIQ